MTPFIPSKKKNIFEMIRLLEKYLAHQIHNQFLIMSILKFHKFSVQIEQVVSLIKNKQIGQKLVAGFGEHDIIFEHAQCLLKVDQLIEL